MKRTFESFTLIELVMEVVILGTLAVMVVPRVMRRPGGSMLECSALARDVIEIYNAAQ